jgi:hypothetical protein
MDAGMPHTARCIAGAQVLALSLERSVWIYTRNLRVKEPRLVAYLNEYHSQSPTSTKEATTSCLLEIPVFRLASGT